MSVRQKHLAASVEIHPLEVAPRRCESYTSCDCSSFLLSCFFCCVPAQVKQKKDNSTYDGSKYTVWRKELPSQQVLMSLFWRFGGNFTPKFQPNRKSKQNKKNRITSKLFKIHKRWQLNMGIKLESLCKNLSLNDCYSWSRSTYFVTKVRKI